MTSVLATGPTDQCHLSQNHCNLFCCHHSAAKLCPTLGPHGLQHARLPCSSPSPRACSNLCPLSPWCHPTISSCPPLLLLPMDSKEIKPVNPKGNQLWIFIGRTDAEAEVPILGPLDARSQLTGKVIRWLLRNWLQGLHGEREAQTANTALKAESPRTNAAQSPRTNAAQRQDSL